MLLPKIKAISEFFPFEANMSDSELELLDIVYFIQKRAEKGKNAETL